MNKRIIILVFTLIILLGGAGAVIVRRALQPSLLEQTAKTVGFSLFTPIESAADWKLDSTSVTYDKTTGVIHMTIENQRTHVRIVMTQQATPDPFVDIPNYSALFLGKLNQYAELRVPLGTIALTKPTELKGGQSAVGNIRGTLLFAHPSTNLSDSEWRAFFTDMRVL